MFFLLVATLFGLFIGQFVRVDIDPKAQTFLVKLFDSAKTQTPQIVQTAKTLYSNAKQKSLKPTV
jgi:hypothetical protein